MKHFLYTVEESLAMLCFAATTALVLVGAASRTLGMPIVESVDLAQLGFAWTCALGADIALKHKAHVVIDVVVKRLPLPVRRALGVLWHIVMLGFLAMLVWYGAELTLLNTQRKLGDVGISYAWVTVTVPVAASLMSLTLLHSLWQVWRGHAEIAVQGRDGDAL
ncbi:MAG: TRAP transporter small permease [Rhodocyclaceae bacterium]